MCSWLKLCIPQKLYREQKAEHERKQNRPKTADDFPMEILEERGWNVFGRTERLAGDSRLLWRIVHQPPEEVEEVRTAVSKAVRLREYVTGVWKWSKERFEAAAEELLFMMK